MWSLLSNSFDRVIGKNLIGYNNKLCACINKTASLIWSLQHLAFEIAWETEKRITEVEPIIIERKIKKKKISFVIINDDFSFNIDCSIINFHTPDLNSENLKNTWAIDFEKSNIAIQIITYYGTLKRDEIKETAYKALISYYETYLRGKRPDERISEIISKPKFSEIKPYMENIFRNGNEKNINELYNQTVVYLIDNDYLRDICFPHDEKILSTSLYSCLKETVETGENR